MKVISLLFVSQWLILSCTTAQEGSDQKQPSTDSLANNTAILSELTPEQETAFDALNALQRQLPGQHLYSTFPGLYHDCFPSDSSFVISNAELLTVIEELIAKYSTDITIEEYNKLAADAVLAQEEYAVEQCYGTSFQLVNGVLKSVSTKTSGFWILPKVLGRRDVVLKW